MKSLVRVIIALVGLAAVGLVVWWVMSPAEDDARVKMRPSQVRNIRAMVSLCTVEVSEEIPVKGRVGTRHLVARQRVNGTVSFDLEKLQINEYGDTLIRVVLPPEIVDVRESTEPDSYTVIDSWNDNPFGSTNFTTAEENELKSKTAAEYRRRMYAKGYVRKARADAVESLRRMLAPLSGCRVEIIDPQTPNPYLNSRKLKTCEN